MAVTNEEQPNNPPGNNESSDAMPPNAEGATQRWEDYESNPENPHLTAAEEAEKDTRRPTGATYGHEGDNMYVSDTFSDEDARDIDPAGTANSTDNQTEGTP